VKLAGLGRWGRKAPKDPARPEAIQQLVVPAPKGQSHKIKREILEASALKRRPNQYYPAEQLVKRGMWVVNADYGVGILLNINEDDEARVMLVNGEGLNRLEIVVACRTLRQALHDEIPISRRAADPIAIKLGYIL